MVILNIGSLIDVLNLGAYYLPMGRFAIDIPQHARRTVPRKGEAIDAWLPSKSSRRWGYFSFIGYRRGFIFIGHQILPLGKEPGELSEYRSKLIYFLGFSVHYSPESLLVQIPHDGWLHMFDIVSILYIETNLGHRSLSIIYHMDMNLCANWFRCDGGTILMNSLVQ